MCVILSLVLLISIHCVLTHRNRVFSNINLSSECQGRFVTEEGTHTGQHRGRIVKAKAS
jgi:hypothetical protein